LAVVARAQLPFAEPTRRQSLKAIEDVNGRQLRPARHRLAPHIATPVNDPLFAPLPSIANARAKVTRSPWTGATGAAAIPAR
jgi:hypothetical protein